MLLYGFQINTKQFTGLIKMFIPFYRHFDLRHGSMRNFLFLLMAVMACFTKIISQPNHLYIRDSLLLHSDFLQEDMKLQVHIPKSFYYSAAGTKYPVTIIFDSQHERAFAHMIGAIDLLTSETQMPESIVVGIPFSKHNRYYLTSGKISHGDSLSGLQRMERFLFSELMPLLKKSYKAGDFLTVIGHSRTAFLVNYLVFTRSADIDAGIALSGFYEEPPLSTEAFAAFLSDGKNFPNKFYYYYGAGTTSEESVYLAQQEQLNTALSGKKMPENLTWGFQQNPHANHITNYWLSMPVGLTGIFSAYNHILDHWFHHRLENEMLPDPINQFKQDLAEAGDKTGTKLLPGLTHIFSLASHYGHQKKDYATALRFIEYGLAYYPGYLDLHAEKIGYLDKLGQKVKVDASKKVLREKVIQNDRLTAEEKKAWFDFSGK